MRPQNDTGRERTVRARGDTSPVPVFPDLVVSAATWVVLLMCVYSVLCIFFPATLDVIADTLAPPAEPKPGWYLLFLYGLLRSAPPIVGALAPVALVVLLVSLPYLDRSRMRSARVRWLRLGFGASVAIAVVALTYVGWRM